MGQYPALVNINVPLNKNGDVANIKFMGTLASEPVAGSNKVFTLRSSKLPAEIKLSCLEVEENLLKGYLWVVFKPVDPSSFSETHTPDQLAELIVNLLTEAGWKACRD